MLNLRAVAQRAFAVLLALSLSACLLDSESGWNGNEPGSVQNDAVSVAITSPTSAPELETTDTSVTLGGSASSNLGIVNVSWQNDRGGNGVAMGTESWNSAGVALELGANTITVTAEDASGVTNSRNIVVKRESGELGSTTLAWKAPTSRIDGSPLTDLAGYRIYYGRMSGFYDFTIDIRNPGILTFVVEGLASGDWHFALAAYDSEDVESARSNEVLRNIS
jgi:hypothetical protein